MLQTAVRSQSRWYHSGLPPFFCKNSLDKLHKYLLCDINTPNLLPAAASLRWWVEKQERSIRQRCAWRWKGHHALTPTSTSLSRFPGLTLYLHIQHVWVSFLHVFGRWISSSLFSVTPRLRVISLNPTDLSSHPLCGKAFHPLVSGLQSRSATNGPWFYAKPIIPSLVRVSFVQLVKHSLWSRSLVTSDPSGATLFFFNYWVSTFNRHFTFACDVLLHLTAWNVTSLFPEWL